MLLFLITFVFRKLNAFIFVPVLWKVYQKNYIQESVIYEQDGEVCCCCLKCLETIKKRIYFSEEKKGYFNELKTILIEYYYVLNADLFTDTFAA